MDIALSSGELKLRSFVFRNLTHVTPYIFSLL